MEFDDQPLAPVSESVSDLRRAFDEAARASSTLGHDARQALSGIRTEGGRAAATGRDLGRVLTGAFADMVKGGKSLQDVLRSVAVDLAKLAAEDLFGSGRPGGISGGGLLNSLLTASAAGNVMQSGRMRAFAKGGVLSEPALFPMRNGMGLAGEAGAEAILPLARGADGRLGVAAANEARPLSIVFNVTANDAASFRRSESQIAAMLQRTVTRGTRNL